MKVNKKTFGDTCNKIDLCNEKFGLSCNKGTCQCEENKYWDESCGKKLF